MAIKAALPLLLRRRVQKDGNGNSFLPPPPPMAARALPLHLLHLALFSSLLLGSCRCRPIVSASQNVTLDSLRDSLVRQEDTIVFCLIERARYPSNPRAYDPSSMPGLGSRSLLEVFVRGSEVLQAKAGRYLNQEELPFFADDLSMPPVPPYSYSQILYPKAASVNVSKTIWNMYVSELLPLITSKGDDSNYASTTASDLICLQALSRRIHLGRFVAEVKFRDAPQDYTPLIRRKDRDALMKLLTTVSVEEAVKKRVEKKATIFGENVTLDGNGEGGDKSRYKVDPKAAFRLYDEWVIPLTKLVEVEYLLRRLN